MVNSVFVLHAYYGATKNVVKNICLLDEKLHFPVDTNGRSRLQYLLDELYPSDWAAWDICENKLKQFQDLGIEKEIGDIRFGGLIPEFSPELKQILPHKNVILPSTLFEIADELKQHPGFKVLAIAPDTMFGLNWQVRAYSMKYSSIDGINPSPCPVLDFNFTFTDKTKIFKFIEKYGRQTWDEINLANFYDVARGYRRRLRRSGMTVMPMELVIFKENWTKLVSYLNNYFDIEIPYQQAHEVLTQWNSLHWPVEETNDWTHRSAFKQFRTEETGQKLMLADTI